MTLRASARSPIDFVPGDETVKVPQDFISGLKFNLIDFGGYERNCPGCGTIRPILGLVSRNEVTFISLSIVREAYFIESWEIYSAMDFKSVSDL